MNSIETISIFLSMANLLVFSNYATIKYNLLIFIMNNSIHYDIQIKNFIFQSQTMVSRGIN